MKNEAVFNILKQKEIQGLTSQCDVIKFKTLAIFIHGGHSNQEKSVILGNLQVACEV